MTSAREAPLETDVAIETPEHIVFRYRVAGPARRALAYLLDLIICYGALIVVGLLVLLAAGSASSMGEDVSGLAKAGAGVMLVALFFVQWVYFVIVETVWGRSPGKAALGLRVLTSEGRPIGFSHAALRNLLRAADALPVANLLGVAFMASTQKFQRIGDLVAGTMVIVADDRTLAEPIRLWPSASPQELASLPDRVALDPDERMALELFLRRRGRLGGAREQELARMIAPAFARRFDLANDPHHQDPVRLLALLYDRAQNAGRDEAPPSSRAPEPNPMRREDDRGKQARSWR
jgi:uncharacterized RDD family membrane protein YckC